jgi:predicted nucleic acid-binding protein
MTRQHASKAARIELQESHDIGEAEAILIAAHAPDSTVLLIDERRARRIAIERGLHTLRTGALLVAAARRGYFNPRTSERRFKFFEMSGTLTHGRWGTSSVS